MIRRPPRSTLDRSSAASDVYKRQVIHKGASIGANATILPGIVVGMNAMIGAGSVVTLSLIHISEPPRPY